MSEPDYRLRARRVAAVGGSEIDKLNASFSKALGYELAKEPGLIIVTGGRAGARAPQRTTVVDGAKQYLENGDRKSRGLRRSFRKGERKNLFGRGRLMKSGVPAGRCGIALAAMLMCSHNTG